MNAYFDPQGCQTLLLKESESLFFSLGSWTILCVRECYMNNNNDNNYNNFIIIIIIIIQTLTVIFAFVIIIL